MTRRRPRLRLRRPRGTGEHIAAGVVALAAASLLLQMVRAARDAVVRGWPLLLVLAAGGLVYGLRRVLRAARARQTRAGRLALLRITLADIDAMDDEEFEFALRDLLIRDGWSARKVGRKGDQAADVIGDHPQHGRIVVQAKHTRVGGKVGSSVMYAVKGTAGPVHKADHANRRHQRHLYPGRHDVGQPTRRSLGRPGEAAALGREWRRPTRTSRSLHALSPEPVQARSLTGGGPDHLPSRLGVWCSTKTGRSTRY